MPRDGAVALISAGNPSALPSPESAAPENDQAKLDSSPPVPGARIAASTGPGRAIAQSRAFAVLRAGHSGMISSSETDNPIRILHNKLFGEQARRWCRTITGGNDKMTQIPLLARVFRCQARR
jgi:hypothetical protein